MGGIGSLFSSSGAASSFHADNPYDPSQLQAELANQKQIYGQQQSLAEALQQQMNGAGPNPAQTQFQGNVQNNIANSQGLIASQRGLNPALAARMGINAAANANSQAANQAATLQAQQQLGAQGQLQGLYGQEQQGNISQQGLYNQAQQSANQLNQQTQAQNAQIVGNGIGGLTSALGGIGAAALTGGASAAIPALTGAAGAAGGGTPAASSFAMPTFGSALAHSKGGKIGGKPQVDGDSEKNDTVPAMLSPGEIVIPRTKAHDPEKAKEFVDHLLKSKGKDDDKGYGNVLEHKRKVADLEKRVKSLESKKRA